MRFLQLQIKNEIRMLRGKHNQTNRKKLEGKMYLRKITCILVLMAASGPASAELPKPAVIPDRLEDVPPISIMEDAPEPYFYNYSWRSFIALNWPALAGPANRGLPDRRRAFGDADGPRVWMTWKSRYEIFQPDGRLPSPWASYAGQNPCGEVPLVNDVVTTLSSFSAFSDFNQARALDNLGNPLVAQNRTYVRYDVRVNEPEFDSIVGHKWYLASHLPASPSKPVVYNIGSTSVKAAWRIVTESDMTNRGRYYVAPAWVFDIKSRKCIIQDVALVGFHIVAKTRERPQWIWFTFEHIDNVPLSFDGTTPPGGFSFNNGKATTLHPKEPPLPISPDNVPLDDPDPMQVVRTLQIDPGIMKINRAY